MLTAIGQVDQALSEDLGQMLVQGCGKISADQWNPINDGDVNVALYDRYSAELYGVLVSFTSGEAKNVLTVMVDYGGDRD